jgi:RNA polymerase sigma-70 factor (ECF subfamily)
LNDAQIVRGLTGGDEAAIGCAIQKYSKLMWKIAAAVLINAATAEDIEECVADTFVYLWRNYEKYDERRGGIKTWLSVVAKSHAINRYRQLSRKNELPLNDDIVTRVIDLTDELITAETKRALIAAINALGESDREIIIRRYYYQQKPKEIGFVLDMSAKRVENRLYRSKLKLREILNDLGVCQNEKQHV